MEPRRQEAEIQDSQQTTSCPCPSPPQPNHDNLSPSPKLTGTCCRCGGATTIEPPPIWSDISPPPVYRPIRSPAINLPPSDARQAIILAPVPRSEKVPIVSPPYLFQPPIKRIHSLEDIRCFNDSDSGKNFLGFVVALSESIRGHKVSDPCHQSQTLNSIVSIIETLLCWVDEIPPVPQSSRYGNLSFRTWQKCLAEKAESLMLQFLPDDLSSATVEIVPYFIDSFGNLSRIDYGTGHETNFAAWLYCLARLGRLKEEDYQAIVSRIFVEYPIKL